MPKNSAFVKQFLQNDPLLENAADTQAAQHLAMLADEFVDTENWQKWSPEKQAEFNDQLNLLRKTKARLEGIYAPLCRKHDAADLLDFFYFSADKAAELINNPINAKLGGIAAEVFTHLQGVFPQMPRQDDGSPEAAYLKECKSIRNELVRLSANHPDNLEAYLKLVYLFGAADLLRSTTEGNFLFEPSVLLWSYLKAQKIWAKKHKNTTEGNELIDNPKFRKLVYKTIDTMQTANLQLESIIRSNPNLELIRGNNTHRWMLNQIANGKKINKRTLEEINAACNVAAAFLKDFPIKEQISREYLANNIIDLQFNKANSNSNLLQDLINANKRVTEFVTDRNLTTKTKVSQLATLQQLELAAPGFLKKEYDTRQSLLRWELLKKDFDEAVNGLNPPEVRAIFAGYPYENLLSSSNVQKYLQGSNKHYSKQKLDVALINFTLDQQFKDDPCALFTLPTLLDVMCDFHQRRFTDNTSRRDVILNFIPMDSISRAGESSLYQVIHVYRQLNSSSIIDDVNKDHFIYFDTFKDKFEKIGSKPTQVEHDNSNKAEPITAPLMKNNVSLNKDSDQSLIQKLNDRANKTFHASHVEFTNQQVNEGGRIKKFAIEDANHLENINRKLPCSLYLASDQSNELWLQAQFYIERLSIPFPHAKPTLNSDKPQDYYALLRAFEVLAIRKGVAPDPNQARNILDALIFVEPEAKWPNKKIRNSPMVIAAMMRQILLGHGSYQTLQANHEDIALEMAAELQSLILMREKLLQLKRPRFRKVTVNEFDLYSVEQQFPGCWENINTIKQAEKLIAMWKIYGNTILAQFPNQPNNCTNALLGVYYLYGQIELEGQPRDNIELNEKLQRLLAAQKILRPLCAEKSLKLDPNSERYASILKLIYFSPETYNAYKAHNADALGKTRRTDLKNLQRLWKYANGYPVARLSFKEFNREQRLLGSLISKRSRAELMQTELQPYLNEQRHAKNWALRLKARTKFYAQRCRNWVLRNRWYLFVMLLTSVLFTIFPPLALVPSLGVIEKMFLEPVLTSTFAWLTGGVVTIAIRSLITSAAALIMNSTVSSLTRAAITNAGHSVPKLSQSLEQKFATQGPSAPTRAAQNSKRGLSFEGFFHEAQVNGTPNFNSRNLSLMVNNTSSNGFFAAAAVGAVNSGLNTNANSFVVTGVNAGTNSGMAKTEVLNETMDITDVVASAASTKMRRNSTKY